LNVFINLIIVKRKRNGYKGKNTLGPVIKVLLVFCGVAVYIYKRCRGQINGRTIAVYFSQWIFARAAKKLGKGKRKGRVIYVVSREIKILIKYKSTVGVRSPSFVCEL